MPGLVQPCAGHPRLPAVASKKTSVSVRAGFALIHAAREAQRELGAAGGTVLDADGRGVRIGDALHDREAEPGAAGAPPVAPPEALKDQLALVVLDAGALIEHVHGAAFLDHDLHRRTRR